MEIGTFLADLRIAARGLRKRPVFGAVAVLTLGLGIGANVAMFSIVNATILAPLPYHEPDRLAVVFGTSERGASQAPHPPATYLDFEAQARSFDGIAAAEVWAPTLASGDAEQPPEKVTGLRVTPNLFAVLGVQPERGRPLQAEDAVEGAANTVVVTERLAKRLGGTAAVLGTMLRLDGHPHQVVGVLPDGFVFPTFWVHDAQVFRTLQWSPAMRSNRRMSTLRIFGRLRDGVDPETADAEIRGIAARLAGAYPESNQGISGRVTPLSIATGGVVRPTVLALFVAVGLLLLVACANLAGLLIARAVERQSEMAVRQALGAGVARLGAILAAETVLLVGMGAAAGIAIAAWGLSLTAGLIPDDALEAIHGARRVGVDRLAVAFTVGLGALAAGLFGMAPAYLAAGSSPAGSLREKGATGHRRLGLLRSGLVIGQCALAFTLVVLCGWLVASFRNLASADAGFDADGVLSFVAPVSGTRHAEPGRKELYYQQAVEQLRALPGVQTASAVNHVPLLGDEWGTSYLVEGEPIPQPGDVPRAVYRAMMPGYLATIGARLREGRDFNASDNANGARVAIVNASLAENRWPGESALGKRIRLGSTDSDEPWREVVGVVEDLQQGRWGTAIQEEVFLAFAQDPLFRDSPSAPFAMTLVVRAVNGQPEGLIPSIRDAMARLSPEVPLAHMKPMREGVRGAFWRPRLAAATGAFLAILAALLSALGIYGALTQLVNQRRRAIGIRMALGESPRQVLQHLLLRGFAMAAAGVLLGLPLAVGGGRLVESALVNVKPQDLAMFGLAALAVGAMGLVATLLPAWRAASIDPAAALRGD